MKNAFCLLVTLTLLSFYPDGNLLAQEAGAEIDSARVLSPEELLSLKSLGSVQISGEANEIIYAIYTPRGANEAAGGSHVRYVRTSIRDRVPRPLFSGDLKASSPRFSPDGTMIGFIHAAKGEQPQVWAKPRVKGKMQRLTNAPEGVQAFRWQPGAKGIAYLSREGSSEKEKELAKRGYSFIYYEENLKSSRLHLASFDENWDMVSLWQLSHQGHVWDFEFNRQGDRIAASISERPLIDEKYMFRKLHIIELESGESKQVSLNKGKLGNYAFSPDGSKLAYTAALNINDHQVSQAFVLDLGSGELENYTPENFRGHVNWVGWKNDGELLYHASEGTYPTLNLCNLESNRHSTLLDGEDNGVIFNPPAYTNDFKHFIFTASTPDDPSNLYYWAGSGYMLKSTKYNSWLRERLLGEQEVISFKARDGQRVEGILIRPVGYDKDSSYPLVVYVHGGPEAGESNGWKSRYSTPGQVMAGKGYLVLYLNYRASTGYGVDYAMEGFMDPAGKEFDDIADAIDWMVEEEGADPLRIGMAGGSYGGYASAWFATYYTSYVRAVCMFVGISNLISKRGTTDIPYEELYVHSGEMLEEQWQMNLERSPVYWAHQSKTATLIYGGAADTRVHPAQSVELYRRMKMNEHPAVRLVQYPGEGHGNRRQPGRIDVLYRQMEWLDWYVRDLKPLDGPMPRLDISDRYGLDWSH